MELIHVFIAREICKECGCIRDEGNEEEEIRNCVQDCPNPRATECYDYYLENGVWMEGCEEVMTDCGCYDFGTELDCYKQALNYIRKHLTFEPNNACAVLAYVQDNFKCYTPEIVRPETPYPFPDINLPDLNPGSNDDLPGRDGPYDEDHRKPIWRYHTDHLGSSTYLTDNFGRPSHYYETLPFGEMMVEHNQSANVPSGVGYDNKYKFNGKELDDATQMYYYGARYYDPRISIFVSVDPLAEKFPDYTPYNYTLNNPINLVDPDGRAPEHIIIRNSKNKDGSINMNVTVVGKVLDLTSNNSINVPTYIASVKSNLEKGLSGSYKTSDGIRVNVNVQVQLTQAKGMRDIGADDHVIGIVDSFQKVKQFGVESTNAGMAHIEGNVALLKSQYLNGYNSLEEHEFGHIFGLGHKDGTFMSSTNSSNKTKTEDQQKQMFERFRMINNKKMRNVEDSKGDSKSDLKNLLRESKAKYETDKL